MYLLDYEYWICSFSLLKVRYFLITKPPGFIHFLMVLSKNK